MDILYNQLFQPLAVRLLFFNVLCLSSLCCVVQTIPQMTNPWPNIQSLVLWRKQKKIRRNQTATWGLKEKQVKSSLLLLLSYISASLNKFLVWVNLLVHKLHSRSDLPSVLIEDFLPRVLLCSPICRTIMHVFADMLVFQHRGHGGRHLVLRWQASEWGLQETSITPTESRQVPQETKSRVETYQYVYVCVMQTTEQKLYYMYRISIWDRDSTLRLKVCDSDDEPLVKKRQKSKDTKPQPPRHKPKGLPVTKTLKLITMV